MSVFGPLRAQFESAEAPRAGDAEIAFYLERLPHTGSIILEPMCGYGRVLTPLAAAGLNLQGVDIAPSMLEECGAALARAAKTAPLFRQDIAELNLPFRYGAAYIAGASFQWLTDGTRARAALARIRAHLVDPGLLLLDLRVPSERMQRIAAPLVEVRTAMLADGSRIALRSETTMYPDARLARTQSRYVHRRGNALLGEESDVRAITWYAPDDIVAMLGGTGFRDVAIGPSPRDGGEDLIFSVAARA